MEKVSDKKNFCLYFNSSVPCPLGSECTKQFIHSEERKKLIESLFRLGLYYRKKADQVLCYTSSNDRDCFYQNLRQEKICENYYILGKCEYGDKCFFGQHISPKTQQNKLKPIAPNKNWKPPMCGFGEGCLRKNNGCRYSHGEENLKDEIRYGKQLKTEPKTVEKQVVKKINIVNEEEIKLEKKSTPQKIHKLPKKVESSHSSARGGESTSDDEVDNRSQVILCKACPLKAKNKANIMFLPCGDQYRCAKCAQDYLLNKGKECGLCGEPVKFIKFIKFD